MLIDQIERKQGGSQVIKYAHKQNDIESLSQLWQAIATQLAKLDVKTVHFSGKPGLRKICGIEIDAEHSLSAAPLHFQRIESRIAPDIENRFARQVLRDGIPKI